MERELVKLEIWFSRARRGLVWPRGSYTVPSLSQAFYEIPLCALAAIVEVRGVQRTGYQDTVMRERVAVFKDSL